MWVYTKESQLFACHFSFRPSPVGWTDGPPCLVHTNLHSSSIYASICQSQVTFLALKSLLSAMIHSWSSHIEALKDKHASYNTWLAVDCNIISMSTVTSIGKYIIIGTVNQPLFTPSASDIAQMDWPSSRTKRSSRITPRSYYCIHSFDEEAIKMDFWPEIFSA